MGKEKVFQVIEQMNSVFEKVEECKDIDINLSERVLENRIITLEGYIRFLETEGIPILEDILQQAGDDNIDR